MRAVCQPFAGAQHVLGGLTHLPVAVGQRRLQRSIDRFAVERGERQNGAASHGGLVGAAIEDRRQPAGSPMAPNDGDSTPRAPARRRRRHRARSAAEHIVVDRLLFAARPRRSFDDRRVEIVEQRRSDNPDASTGDHRRPAADGRRIVGERGAHVVVAAGPGAASAPSPNSRVTGSGSPARARAAAASPVCPATATSRHRGVIS